MVRVAVNRARKQVGPPQNEVLRAQIHSRNKFKCAAGRFAYRARFTATRTNCVTPNILANSKLFSKEGRLSKRASWRGGGSTLVHAASVLNDMKGDTDDEQTGINIVRRALEEPLRQIASNAGMEGSVVINRVREAGKGIGLNAMTEEYVDLIEAGVVDPEP